MSRAQRCHRGWRGCLVSRAAIGSPSGCPRDRRHCLRHANSGTSRRGSTARVLPSRSVSPCRACVCLFFSRYPSLPRPARQPSVFLFPAFGPGSSFVLYLLPSPSSRKTGAPTSLALPSLGRFPSRALPHRSRSHSRLFLAPSRIAPLFLSPLFRDRVAHPIPTTPMLQDAGVPPPPADRRRGVPRAHNPSTKRAIRNN